MSFVSILQMTKGRSSNLLKFAELLSGQVGFGCWSLAPRSTLLTILILEIFWFPTTFPPPGVQIHCLDLLLKKNQSWTVLKVNVKQVLFRTIAIGKKSHRDRTISALNAAWPNGHLYYKKQRGRGSVEGKLWKGNINLTGRPGDQTLPGGWWETLLDTVSDPTWRMDILLNWLSRSLTKIGQCRDICIKKEFRGAWVEFG